MKESSNGNINREWTTTLIKDFDGEINYYVTPQENGGQPTPS